MAGQRHQLAAAQGRQIGLAFGDLPAAVQLELAHTWLFVLTLEDALFATAKLPQAISENQTVSA